MEHAYTISPARYAKGRMVVRCPSSNGMKSRAARLIGDGLNCRYSGRSGGYIASPSQVERFERLYSSGFDASFITGAIDHFERGVSGLNWREADKLAKQWANAPEIPAPASAQARNQPIAAPEGLEPAEALSGPPDGKNNPMLRMAA